MQVSFDLNVFCGGVLVGILLTSVIVGVYHMGKDEARAETLDKHLDQPGL